MQKWKRKFDQSNKKTLDDMKRLQKSYHYNFFGPAAKQEAGTPEAGYKTYSRFTTVDSILIKGNMSDV